MKVLVFPYLLEGNAYYAGFLDGLGAAGMEHVSLLDVLLFKSNFDVMHLHHPDHAVTRGSWLRAAVGTLAVSLVAAYARLTSRPVVWMVHDVEPAQGRRTVWLGAFMTAFIHLISAYVFLSRTSQRQYYDKRPRERRKPFTTVPHSCFPTVLYAPDTLRRHRAKYDVRDDEMVVSFLGDIKPNTGVEFTALIPERVEGGTPVRTVIYGRPDRAFAPDHVERILRDRPWRSCIRMYSRPTDAELALWIQASDAVFMPYRSGSCSRMAYQVLSNHGRIISSDLPIFKEVEEWVGPSWIRCVDVRDADAIRNVVESLPLWGRQKRDVLRLDAILEAGRPAETGRVLFEFYQGLRPAASGNPARQSHGHAPNLMKEDGDPLRLCGEDSASCAGQPASTQLGRSTSRRVAVR